MEPWRTLESVDTRDGVLELRRRGERDFLITLDGRVLMNSAWSRSEAALAELGCGPLASRSAPRVLLGGLGLGVTLRHALERLPWDARVVVAELHPAVVEWCQGPLALHSGAALSDPRVEVEVGDVMQSIARAATKGGASRFDAILLDLYEGPAESTRHRGEPWYGASALERTVAALTPDGIFAVWGEQTDTAFERRLRRAGFAVRRERPGHGGRRHAVYVATRAKRAATPRRESSSR